MKLSVSAYRAHASAHKKILSSSYQLNYGSTAPAPSSCATLPQFTVEEPERRAITYNNKNDDNGGDQGSSEEPGTGSLVQSLATSRDEDDDSSNNASSDGKSSGQRTKSNQRWMKLRTTVQLSSAISTIQKKPPLKREDSFLKRFSTRQIPETQETVEDTGSEGGGASGGAGNAGAPLSRRRRRVPRPPRTVVNPDENFYFYWLWLLTGCVLYNLWTLIVRQSFPELQALASSFWFACDCFTDIVFAADLVVQLRTGYLEQGLMVYDARKLAGHYLNSRAFLLDLLSLTPLDLLQLRFGTNPMLRFPRFLKVYRAVNCYYIVESRTVYPNFWRVINLIHILLILAHWFGCFYFLLSEAEGFQGDWVYPHRPGDYATLTRKYLGSLYWSTLTLTTIGDLPTPETNAEYVFTIVSYLIGVFIFATIVGQVGNVITNRNANRLEFERLLDGAKTYMRHHKVPGGMKRRVLRWYDYSWSRGRIQGGGDINTALGLLPDKLKTELALHVNLSVLKKVTIFQECQPEFLHDLVLKMKAYIFTPGDSICRKGEVAREMFIIADGILEVISETGRVLTTMKAGDFFGEIGILNLDGLNKRTADVRSVGYSELFSLSREDVLAAMKDYPEAQEILQTLGRKRLQEARSCSRKAKGESVDDKMDGDDNSGPKRIVHRLRSDVKGLRNALRSRSRPTRRSINGESLEMRALGAAAAVGAAGSTGPKGVLRRMPRVESDENHHAEDEGSGSADPSSGAKEEKVISPLGAGLPLLARLKLLKERQEREEKEARQHAVSVPQVPPTPCQPAPVTSAEPEVIGAGLPLLQRLLLLKAKEDREKSLMGPSTSGVDKITLSSNPPSSTDTISPSSLKSPLSPTVKTLSPVQKGSGSNSSGKSLSPTTKPSRKNSSGSSDSCSKPKVSFKDKIMKVQSDGTSISQPLSKEKDNSGKKIKTSDKVPPILKSDKLSTLQSEPNNQIPQTQPISIPSSVVNRIKSPVKAVGTTFRDKLKLLQGSSPSSKEGLVSNVPNKIDILSPSVTKNNTEMKSQQPSEIENSSCVETIKEQTSPKRPWSKLKKAAILSDSRDSSSSRQSSVTSEYFKEKSVSPSCITESAKTDISAKNTALSILDLGNVTPSSITSSDTIMPSLSSNVSDKDNLGLKSRTDSENLSKSELVSTSSSSRDNTISHESIITKDGETETIAKEPSNIFSFNECSPVRKRTDSMPSKYLVTRKIKNYVSVEDLSPEYGMLPFVKKLKILNERQKLAQLENEMKTKRSSSFDFSDSNSEVDKLIRCNSEGSSTIKRPIHCRRKNTIPFGHSIDDSQILLSPESNETMERRNLKSILKKLSEDVQESSAFCSREFKKLIRAPTIEGYAARHSKFSKSVTFNRDTLTSPPDSATEQKPLFPISNPYHRLNNPPSVDSCEQIEKDDGWFYTEKRDINSLTSNNLENISRNGDFIGLENSPILSDMLTEKNKDLDSFQSHLDPKYNYNRPVIETLHPEEIKVPTEKPKLSLISAMSNQRKLFRGSLEEQEYFGEVLIGIKHVIQGHLHEVQGKFQDRFNNLEMEVKRRDEIISQLQNRIQELERIGLSTNEANTYTNTNIQQQRANSLEGEDKTMVEDLLSHEADTISGLTASSGSDEISMDQGFMRGDSLDTVFTTSPPNTISTEDDNDNRIDESETFMVAQPSENIDITEEVFERLNLDLEQLTNYPIQPATTKHIDQYKRRDSKGNQPEMTYSRQKAAKMKEKQSWEQNTDQEMLEIHNLSRSISPGFEQQMLLSPDSKTSHHKMKRASHPFHLFGSHLDGGKSKIKKTSSMDTGIHHTGIKGEPSTPEHEHRKFSLGSFFGYKGHHSSSKQPPGFLLSNQNRKGFQQESVIVDMGSEYGSSDGNSSSTSSSSGDSDYIPRTPAFEQFHGRRDSASSTISSRGRSATSSGSGGDWEVFMLAEELDRRERDEARRMRGAQGRRAGEPSVLNSLEEESDTPITPQHHGMDFVEVEDLPHHSESINQYCSQKLQKTGSFSGSSSSTAEWLHRRSRGLILRASSLEHPEPSRSPSGSILPGRLDSFKSSSTDGHKRL